MKIKKIRADKVQPGDKIPFTCPDGKLVDVVKSVTIDGPYITIRFEATEISGLGSVSALPIVKLCDEAVDIVERKPE